MKKILLLAVTLLTVSLADAEISLPQLFQSGMVLQRGKLIPIWGKAAPGELVTVRFNKKQYATTADAHGSWRINLPKMKAGGPYTLTVGNHVLTNILVGDVSNVSILNIHRKLIPTRTTMSVCFVCRTRPTFTG